MEPNSTVFLFLDSSREGEMTETWDYGGFEMSDVISEKFPSPGHRIEI